MSARALIPRRATFFLTAFVAATTLTLSAQTKIVAPANSYKPADV